MTKQRNVGLQTVQVQRTYHSPNIISHNQLENQDFNSFFYTPRTLSTLALLIATLNFVAYGWCDELAERSKPYFFDAKNPDVFEAYRWPILFGFLTLIGFAMTQFPDSVVRRPHPIFWRIVMGAMLGYAMFMTVVLILPIDKARALFKIFHPSMGNPLPEKSYADDCRVFTPEHPTSSMFNIYDAVFDVHFIAHLGGWWFKMMIIRDTKLAWITSGSFELIEISFRHWLPNFWECWWDHLLLDLFGCNMFGIILGAYTIKLIGVSRINWIYKKPRETKGKQCREGGALARAISKLKPNVFIKHEWSMVSSLKRYLQVWFYIWFILSVDSMNFFLKYVLWVGAESDLLKARVLIWALAAIVTSKEFYEYIDDPNCRRVGPFYWLSTFTILVEYSIVIKFSRGLFTAPFPWYVKVIVVSYSAVFLAGAVYSYLNGLHNQEPSTMKRTYNLEDPDIFIQDTQAVLREESREPTSKKAKVN